MLTRVPTKCLSQHCVKASILQQVSCSWVTSCTCQGTPINAAAMHFPKVSHGLCVPLGPDDGHAFWQRGVSIQQIFLWLHRPVGWHLCQWCSNASVQTGLPSQICATLFGKIFSNLALPSASWCHGKWRHQHQRQHWCLLLHDQELQRGPALTLCCRGTCLLNCLACNACVKSASSTKNTTQRENQTNPVAAKLQCIHYIEPCSIPWQCLEFHPKATHPVLLHIPHGAQHWLNIALLLVGHTIPI